MDRKTFIRQCGLACLGGMALPGLLQGCSASKVLSGSIEGDDLVVPLSDFKQEGGYKSQIVVRNSLLQFPICVIRFGEADYTALLMKCTHQGAELQAFGDRLQCPAHGSEFDLKGAAQNGPATQQLRTFPIVVTATHLKISLKK